MIPDKEASNRTFYMMAAFAAVLFFPAYLINLGIVPCIEDEAIRGLVAFEMLERGDLVTPTVGGDLYLKKPPLFNWILIVVHQMTGDFSEVTLRIPVILSIILYALTIFFFVRREFGTRAGLLNALVFVTLGRILFYESLHGLIDITFSWFTYSLFMIGYYFRRKERYLALFLTAYGITAISFLLKGLPSLVFLGATLLVLFWSRSRWVKLISWQHLAGILLFIAVVGGYYAVYFTRNDIGQGRILEVMLGELTRRTVIRFGIWKTVLHLFTYPFEMIYHFLPWSILVILLFKKGIVRNTREHPFLRYNALLFLLNIIPYWTSPESFPRYILMLVPLLMTILLYHYSRSKEADDAYYRITGISFGIILVLAAMATLVLMFFPTTKGLSYIRVISPALFISLLAVSYFYWKMKPLRILWLVIALFILRIGFGLSMVRLWGAEFEQAYVKEQAYTLAEETAGKELFTYWNDEKIPSDPYYGRQILRTVYHFYLTEARKRAVFITSERKPGVLYLADIEHVDKEMVRVYREATPRGQLQRVYLLEFIRPQ